MKTLLLLAAGLATLLTPASAKTTLMTESSNNQGSIRVERPAPETLLPQSDFPEGWQPYEAGIARARSQRKFVMIQFFNAACKPCQRLSQDVTAEPMLDDLIRKHFVLVRVNQGSNRNLRYRNRTVTEKQLTALHQVKKYPTLLFLSPKGQLIGRHSGEVKPQELHDILNYLATGSYNKMEFSAYRAKRKS